MKFLNEYEFLEKIACNNIKGEDYKTKRIVLTDNDENLVFIEFVSNDKKGLYLSCKRRLNLNTLELSFERSAIDCFIEYNDKEEMKNKIAVWESIY